MSTMVDKTLDTQRQGMGTISRTDTKLLVLANCPCCGGDVTAGDCGYSSFNAGWAKCGGECGRKWDLGCVADTWSAGEKWNELAAGIRKQLKALEWLKVAFAMLKFDWMLYVSRNFIQDDLEEDAAKLLAKLEEIVIGGQQQGEPR